MKTDDAAEWAKFLVEDVFFDVAGFPTVLRSDKGPEFNNKVIAAVNDQLGVKHTFGASFHPQSQGYIEGRHKAINNVLRAYASKNKDQWATFAKLAQWSMRSAPRRDRGGKSLYEIVTGLKPQGPLDAVFAKFNQENLSPSVYVRELNKYLSKIRDQIFDQLAAEYDKQRERIKAGGRSPEAPCKGDLVFVRRTPDAVQRIIDGKKSKDDETVSKRLLPYADPKLYRVKDITAYGLYHLEDPATGEPVATYKNPVSLDRLILYGDLPPQEQPLNPDEEVWIEIKSNDYDKSQAWLVRQVIAQCDTGEVKIADKNGEDVRIIDLAKYCYHFVKPPSKDKPAVAPVAEAKLSITADPERHPETGKMWCSKCGNHGRQNESFQCENCQDWDWEGAEDDS